MPVVLAVALPFGIARASGSSTELGSGTTQVASVQGRVIDCGESEAFINHWSFGEDAPTDDGVPVIQLLRNALEESGVPDQVVNSANGLVMAAAGDVTGLVGSDGALKQQEATTSELRDGQVLTEVSLIEGVVVVVAWGVGPWGIRVESMSGCVEGVFGDA